MNPFALLNALRAYRLARHLKTKKQPRPLSTFGYWYFIIMITIALSFILLAAVVIALHHFLGLPL